MIISRIKNYDKSFRAIVPSGLGIVPEQRLSLVILKSLSLIKRRKETNLMLEYKKDGWKAAISLAPAMILLAVFTFWPILILLEWRL